MEHYEKLVSLIESNLHDVEERGLTAGNLDSVSKLVDIQKDILKIRKEEMEMAMASEYGRRYRDGGYNDRDYYIRARDQDREYGRYDSDYGARGVPGSGRGSYRNREHMNRIADGMERYDYDKEQHKQYGGRSDRVCEGLDKLMYAICGFVEETMEYADTPEEKEIIRRHLQKLSRM